jgi:hypothetical protein
MLKLRLSAIFRTTPALVLLLFLSLSAHAKYSGGTGEPNNPYQIAEPNDWIELMNTSADWDKNFIMTADIDVNGVPLTPVGTLSNQFTGIFDGNNCVIYNPDVNMPGSNCIGLFGIIGNKGQISKLGVINVKITGKSYVGGIVGCNSGTMTNCYSTVLVNGNYSVGGLVGWNSDGILTDCWSTGIVNGDSSVGGLVGCNSGTMTNCYSTVLVNGNYSVGGLVGWNSDGVLTDCCSTGIVNGDSSVGGLLGYNIVDINNCHSTCIVRGGDDTGGLIGYLYSGTVTNCYSTGAVNGNSCVGGLVGNEGGRYGAPSGQSYISMLFDYMDYGTVTNCYSTGSVSGQTFFVGGLIGFKMGDINNSYNTGTVSGEKYVGGLVGVNSLGILTNCYSTGKVSGASCGGLVGLNNYLSEINDCFWNIEDSNMLDGVGNRNPDPNGVQGKTTSQMKTRSTFTNAGWDFVGEKGNGPNDVWWILDGKDYPRLWWQLPVDDFNDCNAAPLWIAYQPQPQQAHLEEVNGRLEVNTAGASEDVDAMYIPYSWGIDANKPFALKIDFHFSKSGTGDGHIKLGLVPSLDTTTAKWAEFEAGTLDDNPFYLYEIRDGQWVDEQTCERLLENGTLYISYDPNSDELYFSDTDYGQADAIWSVGGLVRGLWQCETLYIFLGGGSEDGMALTGDDTWMDNFKLDRGTIRQ